MASEIYPGFRGYARNGARDVIGHISSPRFLHDEFTYNVRPVVCKAHELESLETFETERWWMLFRMILYNQNKRTLHVSGVTVRLTDEDSFNVPLDEMKGLSPKMYYDYEISGTARPVPWDPFKKPSPNDEWVGYPIHARCWELLKHHELSDIANRDLGAVVSVLERTYENFRIVNQFGPHWNYNEDPVRIKGVSEIIIRALCQAERRPLNNGRTAGLPVDKEVWQNRLCHLPWEILYMIFDHLDVQEVAGVERAFGLHSGEYFWRSRIPTKFFHEIRHISHERLDWRDLCLKLDQERTSSTALGTRRLLLDWLDVMLDILERQKAAESE
ncbi:hypothetical protein BO94DRAFT_543774 [Aspergillus sclerotioniger CBS 115572]|uniref:F-box domain-containing protein n=1 Tax=Aspergillus sclerotioniger CBS 115572 TaxID=1450535 RepID=A0A317X5U8_9EURO|nr:hypothetical protein BO94DRAFT_543774 [Aspergillus sclerotioniger CBS 115572]PWY93561.1 hypothetical protein BO94DRAFT_543774 [Aspergillus sclerotioniger CBS 115572]